MGFRPIAFEVGDDRVNHPFHGDFLFRVALANPPAPPQGSAARLPDYYQKPTSSASLEAVVAAKDAFFSRL